MNFVKSPKKWSSHNRTSPTGSHAYVKTSSDYLCCTELLDVTITIQNIVSLTTQTGKSGCSGTPDMALISTGEEESSDQLYSTGMHSQL